MYFFFNFLIFLILGRNSSLLIYFCISHLVCAIFSLLIISFVNILWKNAKCISSMNTSPQAWGECVLSCVENEVRFVIIKIAKK